MNELSIGVNPIENQEVLKLDDLAAGCPAPPTKPDSLAAETLELPVDRSLQTAREVGQVVLLGFEYPEDQQ